MPVLDRVLEGRTVTKENDKGLDVISETLVQTKPCI